NAALSPAPITALARILRGPSNRSTPLLVAAHKVPSGAKTKLPIRRLIGRAGKSSTDRTAAPSLPAAIRKPDASESQIDLSGASRRKVNWVREVDPLGTRSNVELPSRRTYRSRTIFTQS